MAKKIRIISFTECGASLGRRLACAFSETGYDALAYSGRGRAAGDDAVSGAGPAGSAVPPVIRLADFSRDNFQTGTVLIFIGAAGIAVRAIAPYVRDKKTDAAVIVIDEKGRFCIPILSGHIGEANLFAEMAAAMTGGQAVLTTATDVNALFAVDVLANRNGLTISDMTKAKVFSAALLESRKAAVVIPGEWADMIRIGGEVPEEVETDISREPGSAGPPELPRVLISPSAIDPAGTLQLIPRCLAVGIGCRRGKSFEELKTFFEETLSAAGLNPKAVAGLYSIDLKKDEEGIRALAAEYDIPFETFSAERLRSVNGVFSPSSFVAETTGVDNVCERAAMAAAQEAGGRLILKKTARDGMTLAAAVMPLEVVF